MASSSSSAPTGRGGEEMERMRAPVPYRVASLAYRPAKFCHCKKKAPCWTSWSDENPGRRYYRYPAGMTTVDCGYYVWVDREATPYERTLLVDLRNAIWQLRREKEEDRRLIDMEKIQNAEMMEMVQQLQKEKDELQQKVLEQKELAMVVMASKKKKEGSSCWFNRFIVVVAVLGLVFVVMYSAL